MIFLGYGYFTEFIVGGIVDVTCGILRKTILLLSEYLVTKDSLDKRV